MPTTYEPIATTTLGSATNSITFSSIPQTYTDLRMVVVGSVPSGTGYWTFRFNGDAGTNYSQVTLGGNGSSVYSSREANYGGGYLFFQGSIPSSLTAVTLDVFNYTSTTKNKTSLATYTGDLSGSGNVERGTILWRNTSAVTSWTVRTETASNFAIGTTATIYGIKAA